MSPEQAARRGADDIARRAYQRYLDRGGQHGQDMEDWFEAERELRSQSVAESTTPPRGDQLAPQQPPTAANAQQAHPKNAPRAKKGPTTQRPDRAADQ